MNKWNVLLTALNSVYGHDGENHSTFKPINRYFDQNTGEMITIIQYTTKKQGETVIQKKKRSPPVKQGLNFIQNLLNQKKSE